jgi:nicotinate-nucleotide adenylyltransferase
MRIGIYGGTFNPIHVGHLIVIESVREQLQFDRLLFVPSANPPNKSDPALAPAADRLHMARLAVEGNREFEISDIEICRGGISYTVDTLKALSDLYPRASLSLIIGADNLIEFQSWRAPDEILDRAELVVMNRPGYAVHGVKSELSRLAKHVNVPQIGVSGTDIRRRVKLGRSIRYLVPPGVEEYIRVKGLYRL